MVIFHTLWYKYVQYKFFTHKHELRPKDTSKHMKRWISWRSMRWSIATTSANSPLLRRKTTWRQGPGRDGNVYNVYHDIAMMLDKIYDKIYDIIRYLCVLDYL